MRDSEGIGVERDAPVAHSLIEERLFLLTVRCACGGGPLERLSRAVAHRGARVFDVVRARCPRCREEREFRFDATSFFGRFYARNAISDHREPSELLDRVAWIRWARLYLRALTDGAPPGGRALGSDERLECGLLAVRCLDEALKFFARGDEGEESLSTPGSLEAYREAPERYTRIEALGLRLQAALLLAAAGIDPDAPLTRAAAPPVPSSLAVPALREPPERRLGPGGAYPKPALGAAVALPPAPEPPRALPGLRPAETAGFPAAETAAAWSRLLQVLAAMMAVAAFGLAIAAALSAVRP